MPARFSRFYSLIPIALIVALVTVLLPQSGFAQGSGVATLDQVIATLENAKSAQFDVSFRGRIKGKLRPVEKAFVKADQTGGVYMKWTGSKNKGRELIYKPGWNQGKIWIKEGGPLSFSAASIALNDKIVNRDYLRTVDSWNPKKLAAELKKWKQAESITKTKTGSVLAEIPGSGSMELWVAPNKLPKKVLFKNSAGKETESMEFANVKINIPLSDKDFSPTNSEYGFPGYSADGIFIDPVKMKKNLNASWGSIRDYECVLKKRERIGSDLQAWRTCTLKFRKPGDIFMRWIKDPNKGRELLFRKGKDEKVLIRVGEGMMDFNKSVALDSFLLKRETNHDITEVDLGHTVGIISKDLSNALKNGDVKLKFKGVEYIGGRKAYIVESWMKNAKANGYYAPHTIMANDVRTGLPIKIVNYDGNDQLFEEMIWSNIKFNVGLKDIDFDTKNPEYHFE